MLNSWTKILPFIIVQYLARKYCEQIKLEGRSALYVIAYRDTIIKLEKVTPPVF